MGGILCSPLVRVRLTALGRQDERIHLPSEREHDENEDVRGEGSGEYSELHTNYGWMGLGTFSFSAFWCKPVPCEDWLCSAQY